MKSCDFDMAAEEAKIDSRALAKNRDERGNEFQLGVCLVPESCLCQDIVSTIRIT